MDKAYCHTEYIHYQHGNKIITFSIGWYELGKYFNYTIYHTDGICYNLDSEDYHKHFSSLEDHRNSRIDLILNNNE